MFLIIKESSLNSNEIFQACIRFSILQSFLDFSRDLTQVTVKPNSFQLIANVFNIK